MSSIAKGISSLKRHAAGIKPHIQSAFLPELYLWKIDEIARTELTLAGIPSDKVEMLIAGIELEEREWGMTFRMKVPDGRTGGISVIDWIKNFKEIDPVRDYTNGSLKTPEAIEATIKHGARKEGGGDLVEIGDDYLPLPTSFTRDDIEGRGALNPTGLVAMTSATGVSSKALTEALEAVLKAWKDYLTTEMPGAILTRVQNAFTDPV